MRMWNVNPEMMCRKHLLGEHFEMHMFVGTLLKNKSLDGYIKKGLVEVHNIEKRHRELAEEMVKRGFHHHSPIREFTSVTKGKVDSEKNIIELRERCKECRKRGE